MGMSDDTLSATEIASSTGLLRPEGALNQAAEQLNVDPEELGAWFTFAGLAVEGETYMRVARLIESLTASDGWVPAGAVVKTLSDWVEELQRQVQVVTMISALSKFNAEMSRRGEL